MCPGYNPYNGGNINPFGLNNNPYANSNRGSQNEENGKDTEITENAENTKNEENHTYHAEPFSAANNPYAKKNIEQNQEQYLRQRVATASKGELTLMLFEGCCKFLNRAKKAFDIRENSNVPQERIDQVQEINTNLVKAQNILLELMSSLNFDYDVSHKLYPVYNYLYRELVRINFAKDGKALPPVIKILEDYHETWKEVVKKDRKNQYANGQNGSLA